MTCDPGLRARLADPRPAPHRRPAGSAALGSWRISATGLYKILPHGVRTRLARLEGEALVARGLVTERTARRVVREARHLEAERPGDLVCLDRFYIGRLKGVGKLWQRTACDAATSYGIAQGVRGTPRPAQAAAFLAERVLPV